MKGCKWEKGGLNSEGTVVFIQLSIKPHNVTSKGDKKKKPRRERKRKKITF